MSKTPSRAWNATAIQFENIAKEGRRVSKPKASKTDELVDLQPREAAPLDRDPIPAASEKPSQAKRTSTSLYLTPAAHRAIRMHAAEQGVRPHRIYDDALRAYFKAHGLEDFDKLNGTDL